jgi:hypothetical protein
MHLAPDRHQWKVLQLIITLPSHSMYQAWDMRNAFKILVGKPEGRLAFRRPMRRWEDNIRMDLRVTWIGRSGELV